MAGNIQQYVSDNIEEYVALFLLERSIVYTRNEMIVDIVITLVVPYSLSPRRLAQGRMSEMERSGPYVRVLSRLRHSRPFPFLMPIMKGPPGGPGCHSDPLGSRAVSLNDDVIF